jgi:hypothetical protein
MEHNSRKCPNLPTLSTKKNTGSSTQRFFAKEKGKTQVHLIEPMSEGQKKGFDGFGKKLQNF